MPHGELPLDAIERALHRLAQGVIDSGGMEIGAGDAEEEGDLVARAGASILGQLDDRLVDGLAGGERGEAGFDQALDAEAGLNASCIYEKFHPGHPNKGGNFRLLLSLTVILRIKLNRVMELNYHHLRYFWVTAREGGLRAAAEKLNVSMPSISAQIAQLEEELGEPLFRRSGRGNVLTEAGQVALRYADEIFSLGGELASAIRQQPTTKALRLHVGIVDSFPKLVTQQILHPVFALPQAVHVICREGKVEDLLAQLAAHRLDVVLADEPAPGSLKVRVFNHPLGESGVTFCATPGLAATLRKGFPRSLHQAPALLPAEATGLRRSLERWFHSLGVVPRIVAEFEDAALMKVMASEVRGFIAVPTVVAEEAVERFSLRIIGATEECRDQFFAITAERRLTHPAIVALTRTARPAAKSAGKAKPH